MARARLQFGERVRGERHVSARRALGERYYKQEYFTEFNETIDAVFSWADIQAALSDDVKPLFGKTDGALAADSGRRACHQNDFLHAVRHDAGTLMKTAIVNSR